MNIEVYTNDGSKITMKDENFNAKELETKMKDHTYQSFAIGGGLFNRHAFQYILPEGTEIIHPSREGQ